MSEVVSMIDRLPEGYGQVFRLSVFEGMSHKEIAEMLGIEPHSSSSQLARAKKMLRKMMRHYWVAVLLMLLIPVTFFLLRKGDTAIKDKEPIVAKQKDTPKESQQDAQTEHSQEPVIVHQPVHRTTVIATDTPQAVIAQAVDTITSDTLSNIIAREQMETDTIANDTIKAVRKMEIPHYDIADIFPDKQVTGTNDEKRWSLELAYAGQFDEQNRYNQPFTYKPYIDPQIQNSPGEGPTYVVPSSIDNWTDYAIYLANNPNVVSDKTRSIIMRIALSNANLPGDDKILRTSHHRMPITWSLALKYKLDNDIKSMLLEPLYYTFKTKSYRFKGSKFGLLDDVTEQVRSISGESVLHYVLWSLLALVFVVDFIVYSPKLMNVRNPNMDEVETTGTELIQQIDIDKDED